MAEGLRVRVFEIKGRKYQVRAVAEENKVVVRVYSEGEPATSFSYSVESDTRSDLARLHGLHAIETLIEIAQQDVYRELNQPHDRTANGS